MKVKFLCVSIILAAILSGCVVEQPRYAYTRPIAPPPQVVYVQPAYPRPAIGFEWSYHPHYGWGWYHPERGWHRGWR